MTVPDHIPAERVRDIDIYGIAGLDGDIHRAWKSLMSGPDLVWTPRNGGHWVPLRGRLIREMFEDPNDWSSMEVGIPVTPNPVPPLPIQADPPLHTAYRALIQPAFTPKAVAGYADSARNLAIDLIEGFRERGECEFMSDFALKVPLIVFMNMVDLPVSDLEMLHELTSSLQRTPDVQVRAWAFEGLCDYLGDWLDRRAAQPGDDLLSRIALGKVDGRVLSRTEQLGFGITVLAGGLDTVASTMGFSMNFLANSPDHRRQLATDPGLIPNAVEEFLRRFAPASIGRIAAKNLVVRGVEVKKGDMVTLSAFLYGLDDAVFPDAMRVDFSRDASLHGAFGFGPHRCPGSFLARTELRIFLEEWFGRIPEFGIRQGEKTVMKAGGVNSVSRLPLSWEILTAREVG